MRPHRQHRYGTRRNTQEDSTYDEQDYGPRNSTLSSSSRTTRGYRHSDRNPYPRRDGRDWGRGGDRHGEGSIEYSGYGNYASRERAYRDYDGYRASRNQRDYGNGYTHNYDQAHNYNNGHDYGYAARSSRNSYYSDNTYDYAYNHSSGRGPRRERYGEQRRGFHSSASRFNSGISDDPNGSTSDSNPAPSLTSRLFQHRDSLTRVDPIRINKTTRRSQSPRLNIPKKESMEKKMGPDEEYLKTSLEKSEKIDDVDDGTDVDADAERIVRKLLVLDLNGTLVYRSPHRPWRERHPAPVPGATAVTEEDVYAQFDPSQPRPLRTVHPRPYLTSFREYLFHPSTKRWLDTMVWSSAQPHSVGDMVERCFGDWKGELVAIWARDRLGLSNSDYGRKVQTTKDLNKPWNELNSAPLVTAEDSPAASDPLSPPAVRKRNHSARTTLLLDDSPLKAHLQPYNHLCIKEYDLEMRKHDMSVRELEVARNRLADVIAGKKTIEDVLQKRESKEENGDTEAATKPDATSTAPESEDVKSPSNSGPTQGDEEPNTRKRKRKEKKENKKKERIEQQLKKLTDESQNPAGVYDETLLAVVGILDAVKRESNVSAWIRSGGLIKSLIEGGDDGRQASAGSEGTSASVEELGSPKKKAKLSEEERGQRSLGKEESLALVTFDHPPPPASSPPPHETSPKREEEDVESETERTGVPLDDAPAGKGGEKSVEEQLWFNHPGTLSYWALRGKKVLTDMGIDIVVGVVGPTG